MLEGIQRVKQEGSSIAHGKATHLTQAELNSK